jgi:hypothetical protein
MTPEKFINDIITTIKDANEHHNFNMGEWLKTEDFTIPIQEAHTCNSVGCIAGWTCVTHKLIPAGVDHGSSVDGYAREAFKEHFDIETHCLFLPGTSYYGKYCDNMCEIKVETAVRALEILRDKGEVNWKQAFQDTKELYNV